MISSANSLNVLRIFVVAVNAMMNTRGTLKLAARTHGMIAEGCIKAHGTLIQAVSWH